jgi:hypothetical protein
MIFSPRIDMNNSTQTLTQSGLLAVLLQRQHEAANASERRRALVRNFRELLFFRRSEERVLPMQRVHKSA